ncbi:hypothetical protein NL676_016689 [Syzygium grande]|nr:hypothetical protein NL676_016689 [Syzygium grande]
MADLTARADRAFVQRDFEIAVDLYTQAISMSPNDAVLFSLRSEAYMRLRNFTEALADAERAMALDPSLYMSYFQKGNACFHLEDYRTARAVLEAGSFRVPGNAKFIHLIKECDERIAERCGDILNRPLVKTSTQVVPLEGGRESGIKFYQEGEEVVVTILAKGIAAENVAVHFGEQSLSVFIDVPGEVAYRFEPRLFGKIAPEKCRYEVLPSKIEVHLAKAEPLIWPSLDSADPLKVAVVSGTGSQGPSSSSSKRKRVDSDIIQAQVTEVAFQGADAIQQKGENLGGDAAARAVTGRWRSKAPKKGS